VKQTLAVETIGLTKSYRQKAFFSRRASPEEEKRAVDSLSLQIEPGEIFGLLGRNGAGKTSLIKMLCTLLLPSGGTARVNGFDIVKEEAQVRKSVGLVNSDERSFYWRLSGRQNLTFFATLYGENGKEVGRRVDELLDLLDLKEGAERAFNTYSTGMKQRMAIARGLLGRPKIIFMDEPTKGLDPIAGQGLRKLVRERVVENLSSTVILTTHFLQEVEELCGRVAIMDRGKIIASGQISELKRSIQNCQRYFLKLRELTESDLAALRKIEGVLEAYVLSRNEEGVEVRIDFLEENILSEILAFLLQSGGKILSCTRQEISLEEVFCSHFQKPAEKTAQEGALC
jgi:ABC-2 type transport system ATP-binding protein